MPSGMLHFNQKHSLNAVFLVEQLDGTYAMLGSWFPLPFEWKPSSFVFVLFTRESKLKSIKQHFIRAMLFN